MFANSRFKFFPFSSLTNQSMNVWVILKNCVKKIFFSYSQSHWSALVADEFDRSTIEVGLSFVHTTSNILSESNQIEQLIRHNQMIQCINVSTKQTTNHFRMTSQTNNTIDTKISELSCRSFDDRDEYYSYDDQPYSIKIEQHKKNKKNIFVFFPCRYFSN